MGQLLTDAIKSFVALAARSEANGDDDNTWHLATLFVSQQPKLLNVSDGLGGDDVTGAWPGDVLDKGLAAALGGDHAVKK